MFRYRQKIRRWAAGVLLIWLFGVAAGVANACLAPSLAALGGQRSESAATAEAVHGSMAAAGGELHHGSHQSQHEGAMGLEAPFGKANCQDVCDKATVSIPPLKSVLDGTHGHELYLPAVAIACPAPAPSPVELVQPRQMVGLAPPITIAFLRLAL